MKNKLQNTFCAIFFFVTLSATAQKATLMINEINVNMSDSRDLIEFVAVTGGSLGQYIFQWGSSIGEGYITGSAATVAAGDIIVLHFNPYPPVSEWLSKNEYPNAVYPANYDNAWDIAGISTIEIGYLNRVVLVKDYPTGTIHDAVPFTNYGVASIDFPNDVQAIQGHQWYPSDCGGAPCDYASIPTVQSVAVNWVGLGTTPTGNSIQRISYIDTDSSADWTASPQPSTWGALNPGQVISVNEENNSFEKVSVFPNPATDILTIEIPNFSAEENYLSIYNVLGEKCLTLPFDYAQGDGQSERSRGLRIDVSELAGGIYIAEVRAGKSVLRRKFVKE